MSNTLVIWAFCRNLRSLLWVLSSLRLLVICAGAWTSEIWIHRQLCSWGIAMGGRLLKVEGLCYALFMVGNQKLLWLLQELQTLQLYRIWYTLCPHPFWSFHSSDTVFFLVLCNFLLLVIFQTKTAKLKIGLSLSVDNSQSMKTEDFIAKRGRQISSDSELQLYCILFGNLFRRW